MDVPSCLPTEALPREADRDGAVLLDRGAFVDERKAAAELRCTSGIAGLTALRSEWAALTPMLHETRFHHQHAWLLGYLCNLERDPSAVHFFSFYRSGRPVGIFPLRHVRRTVSGVELRVWELPCEPHMDLCDILVARDEDSAALLCELVRALGRPGLPWDALHLPKMIEGAVALRALQAAPLSFVSIARTGQSMHFNCGSLDSALRDASPQFVRNLRRQRRKLDRHGRIEVSMVREPAALEAALADFLHIEASGWKGACGSAIRLHHEVETFYRDLTRQFGAANRCSINLLKLDGKVIAAQYGLIDGRRMNLLKIAYDEAYAAEAPGSRLLHDVLAWCCESNEIDELSLVTGPSWAPGRWNPETLDVWSAHVFNTSPRGLAAYAATCLKPIAAGARTLLLE